jgi:hypothetical protein
MNDVSGIYEQFSEMVFTTIMAGGIPEDSAT